MSGTGAIGIGARADVTNPVTPPPALPTSMAPFVFGWDGSSPLAPAVAAIGGSLAIATIKLQNDLATARSLPSASLETIQQLQADTLAPIAIVGPCLSAMDYIMSVVCGPDKFASGIDPYAMALNVQNLAAAAGSLPQLFDTSNKLNRMFTNLSILAAGT